MELEKIPSLIAVATFAALSLVVAEFDLKLPYCCSSYGPAQSAASLVLPFG
jgi:hypothetical protein